MKLTVQEIPISKLTPWNDNPRHTEKAVAAVSKSIARFGFNVPILCDPDFRIIAGHTRLEASRRLKRKTVPVIVLRLAEKEKELFSVIENKTSELADWDSGKLKALMDGLHSEKIELSGLGFTAAELRRLITAEDEKENAVPAPTRRVRSKSGALWQLGTHRLFCGDSRKPESFERLLGDTVVDHVYTSPPFFNRQCENRPEAYDQHLDDMRRAIGHCRSHLREGGILAWNIGNNASTHHPHVVTHAGLLAEAGFRFIDMIIWVKSAANYRVFRHGMIKRFNLYYPAHQWDVVHIFQKPGEMPRMSPEAVAYLWEHHTDVWQIPPVSRNIRNLGHPGVCPVELPFRTIQAYSSKGAVILDPFGGSGTVLIAAEQLGRQAFLIEMDPAFCDIAVRRWEEYTGQKAVKIR